MNLNVQAQDKVSINYYHNNATESHSRSLWCRTISTYFLFTCLWLGWGLAELGWTLLGMALSCGGVQLCSMSLSFFWYQRASRGMSSTWQQQPHTWDECVHDTSGLCSEGTLFPPPTLHWLKQVTSHPSPIPMGWEVHSISSGVTRKVT